MGMTYVSTDSSTVRSALAANLATASAALASTENASNRLVAALGTGELSGEGYSAIDALFSQLIAPCIASAKDELGVVQQDLDRFTAEDSKVSQYGVLKEDELNTQLAATKSQRDATELQIDANRLAAAAAVSVPGLGESLAATNGQLELVLGQLDNDIRELEDKLQALSGFASNTKGLFLDNLENMAAVTGDTIALLTQLNSPSMGISVLSGASLGLNALATRQKILEQLAGKKITLDADGRVKWGDRFLYRSSSNVKGEYLYRAGQDFNAATGTRIDHYGNPLKAGASAALTSPVDDFLGWNDASKLGKVGKGLGVAGLGLTVVGNYNNYFSDGVQGHDVADFAVDTGVDFASAAVSAGAGAVAGSFFFPPIGTVVGALAGFAVGMVLDADLFGGQSANDVAKDVIKNTYR